MDIITLFVLCQKYCLYLHLLICSRYYQSFQALFLKNLCLFGYQRNIIGQFWTEISVDIFCYIRVITIFISGRYYQSFQALFLRTYVCLVINVIFWVNFTLEFYWKLNPFRSLMFYIKVIILSIFFQQILLVFLSLISQNFFCLSIYNIYIIG